MTSTTEYLVILTVVAFVNLACGYFIGRGVERTRQAHIRAESIRLRHFSPPNVSKN